MKLDISSIGFLPKYLCELFRNPYFQNIASNLISLAIVIVLGNSDDGFQHEVLFERG